MSLPVTFRWAAQQEFDEAVDWYEQRRKGLGSVFIEAVESTIDRIVRNPQRYAVALDDVREALVPRFPYCVYYQIEDTRIVILAVFHTARDPLIWQSRA